MSEIIKIRNKLIPNLTFERLRFSERETPWDLVCFLYAGGAIAKADIVKGLIANGFLGEPIIERVSLIEKIHEYIDGKLAAGGSRGTAATNIRRLREFFSWVDKAERNVNLRLIESAYIDWTEYLIHRSRIVGEISEYHAYRCAGAVAKIFDEILGRKVSLLSNTRFRKRKKSKKILTREADKQNLEETFEFGRALLDIVNSLDVNVIFGRLPVRFEFRSGKVVEEWLRLRPPESIKMLSDSARPYYRNRQIAVRAAWEADTSLRTRGPLVNLRIQAEMLIFISQTGMNMEQVHALKMSKFRYQSHLDGYQVFRVYKGRRQGEVAFEIFSEYREIFERYLKWRTSIFPDDDEGLLFPLLRRSRLQEKAPVLSRVADICKKIDIKFISPRKLRKTRINWLLRRSRDPEITAEMHAHTQETLIGTYEQPSLQVTMIEISRFHARSDPAITPPGPGMCVEFESVPIFDAPQNSAVPDCINPAGCLFCYHHRDIDSEDYVWSLASYRYLKSLELALFKASSKKMQKHSADLVIDRITIKLKHMEQSSELRALWVNEALSRVEEGNYHPRWEGFVRLLEARI